MLPIIFLLLIWLTGILVISWPVMLLLNFAAGCQLITYFQTVALVTVVSLLRGRSLTNRRN